MLVVVFSSMKISQSLVLLQIKQAAQDAASTIRCLGLLVPGYSLALFVELEPLYAS